MAQQKSELLSVVGTVFEIVRVIVNEVLGLGGSDEDVRRILKDTDLRRKIAELIVQKTKILLRKIVAVPVSGTKKFVANDEALKAANVGWIGDNFKKLFLGNAEEDIEAITVAIHRLEKSSLDAPIMAQLADRAEINLAHFFELLKKQSKGEDGVLLTNGYANIAYIKGNDGNLWAMFAHWNSDDGYWYVGAYSVERPGRWHDGRQILSRDS